MSNVLVLFDERSAAGLAAAAAKLGGSVRAFLVDSYDIEGTLAALADACRGAEVVLLANDTYSQEIAPRLAHRLGGACVGDAIDLTRVDGRVRVTRQVYGGKAVAVIELRRTPAVVWVRSKAIALSPLGGERDGVRGAGFPEVAPLIRPEPALSAVEGATFSPPSGEKGYATRIVERATADQTAKLEDAKVIVSGGRGIGGPEGFQTELQPLADLLGAQMAASRAACDAGWVPPTWQVGQTGKKVAPDLYLAIAITGASQHMAGVSEAKTIAAINIDPDAPIFKHAKFGIVEDYKKVVPMLRKKLSEMKGS